MAKKSGTAGQLGAAKHSSGPAGKTGRTFDPKDVQGETGGQGGGKSTPKSKTGEVKCTESRVQYPVGAMYIFDGKHPRSKMSGATTTTSNWLTLQGVAMKPTPAAGMGLGADPSWWEFLLKWEKSRKGVEEWRARLNDPAKYGQFSNNRIFLSFDSIRSPQRALIEGAVARSVENMIALGKDQGNETMPSFEDSDLVGQFKNGQVNTIIKLMHEVTSGRSGAEGAAADILDDLMLPYFHIAGGCSKGSNGKKIPNQGYFIWYSHEDLGAGVGMSDAIKESTDIQNMDLGDLDIY